MSVASAGDANGDGYGDVLVGAHLYSSGESYEGRAYLYLGNAADGSTSVAVAPQARQPGTTTPLSPGLTSTSASTFDVAVLQARGLGGPGDVKLQIEVKPLGTSFDGTDFTTASTYTSSGITGVELQEEIAGLTDATGYHWRARVLSSPADGRAQAWGPWLHGGRTGRAQGGHVFTAGTALYADADGDGFGDSGASISVHAAAVAGYVSDGTDCDDSDATVNPTASEVVADGVDQDCDGVDSCYTDDDGDDYGTSVAVAGSSLDCAAGTGAAEATDCDDSDSRVNPGAAEVVADGIDQDCDSVDGCYADADGDEYGESVVIAGSSLDCVGGTGADNATDCDDGDSSVNPSAAEVVADGIDQDCDSVDACYSDADGDNFGTSIVTDGSSLSCESGAGAAVPGDCDDTESGVNPGASEVVGDEVDEDCDGEERCYVDADGDGARTTSTVVSPDEACAAPGEAAASSDLDCDDADATAYPAAVDTTGSGIDEDCDGEELCFVDADGDGYRPDAVSTVTSSDGDCADTGEALASALTGDCNDADAAYQPGATEADCTDPADYDCDGSTGYANLDGDAYAACEECDDADPSIHPSAAETPGDGVDSDCDGLDLCYVDVDGDGYRADSVTTVQGTTVACDGAGEASDLAPVGDCDDGDGSISPAAIETAGDAVDQDCDGGESCFVDNDGDGYRSEDGALLSSADEDCTDGGEAPATAGLDCDDDDGAVNPAAAEIAGDELDGDCDGSELCLADADGDRYRPDTTSTVVSANASCGDTGEAPIASSVGDCDDTDPAVNPSATETVGDAVDQDCDGAELCYVDGDDDGYRPDAGTTALSSDPDCDDTGEALATSLTGDCDDADATFNPGAAETDCSDPNDYNCDGSTGYADADADGFAACDECDDGDATVNPSASEVPGDLVDQDCDGAELCYVDADDDGYRVDGAATVTSTNLACDGAGEGVATDGLGDCDDDDAGVHPSAGEITGDEVDQDCDGGELCYIDGDGDGYAPDGGATVSSGDALCDAPGEAPSDAEAGDCDDADTSVHPGATEDDCADPVDYNCDGASGYADGDADGFAACEECEDGASAINPSADEVCNGIDDDCDGTADQGAIDASTWYADSDRDGYTSPDDAVAACDAPEGYAVANGEDCDDLNNTVHPDADDEPDDGIDQDCDGADLESRDTALADARDGKGAAGECGCDAGGPEIGWVGIVLVLTSVGRRRGNARRRHSKAPVEDGARTPTRHGERAPSDQLRGGDLLAVNRLVGISVPAHPG